MLKKYSFTRLDNEIMRQIGNRIAEQRDKCGISSTELAELIGVGPNQWSRIENGKSQIKEEHLYAVSQILDVSVDYLMRGETKFQYCKEIMDLLKGLDVKDLERAQKIMEAAFL